MTLKLHRPLSIPERVREAGGVRVLVLSEAEALQFVPDVPALYISITDPGRTSLPGLDSDNVISIVRVSFHDREQAKFGFQLMQEQDARAIWDALWLHEGVYQQVIVHCWAGRCRSSAVAWSIARFLGDDKAGDFYPQYFEPNGHVYRTMQAARPLFNR